MPTAYHRFTASCCLCCALVVSWGASTRCAAERAPVLICQLRSAGEAFADFNFLADAIGLGQLGQIFTITTQQYARGIDQDRSITLLIDAESDNYRWLLCLPTQDLPTFVKSLGKAGESARPAAQGVVEITGKRRFALRQQGNWTLVAESAQMLALPTSMAMEQLVSPASRADIWLAAFPARLPEELKQQVYKAIQTQTIRQLRGVPASSASSILRKAIIQELWDQLGQLVHDLDQLQVELTTDAVAKRVQLQINVAATRESLTFRRLRQMQTRGSQLAGVLNASAAATWNATGTLPPEDAPRLENLLKLAADAAREELKQSHQFTDETTRHVSLVLTEGLFEAGQHALRDGRFDTAGLLLTDRQDLQGVAGLYLANPTPLRQALIAISAESSIAPQAWQLSNNLSQRNDVVLHRLTMKTPADRAMISAFGPDLTLWIGISAQQIWLALGADGARLIEFALQHASPRDHSTVVPFHAQVMSASATRFYQRISEDPRPLRWLESVSEQDRFLIRATPLEEGMRFSITADQGVLQAVGLALVPSLGRAEGQSKRP